jgi:hypothetical protein
LCLNSSPAAIKAMLLRVKFAGNAFAYRTPRSLNYVNGLERTVSHTIHDPPASTRAESSMVRGL